MEAPAAYQVECRAALVGLAFAEEVLLAAAAAVVVEMVVVEMVNHHPGATMGRVAFRRRSRHKSLRSPLPTALSSGPQCRGRRTLKEGVAALAPCFEQKVIAPHGVGIFDDAFPSGTRPDADPIFG